MAEAIKTGNGAKLRRQSAKIGAIVDRAFARREREGTKLSDCEKAAAYLTHIAVYAERGRFFKSQREGKAKQFGQIVLDGIPREINDYTRRMRGCERILKLTATKRPPFVRLLKG